MSEKCNPWETEYGKKIWKTKAQYFTWLRGNLRRVWADNPLRKEWMSNQVRPVTQEERKIKKFHPSTKKVAQCYLCKGWFAASKLEVDHLTPSNGCTTFEEAEEFLWHCAADNPDNWALACKDPCHKVKTYADSKGISFEKAKVTKEAIAIQKSKADETEWFSSRGIVPESNASKRRGQIIEYLEENDEDKEE